MADQGDQAPLKTYRGNCHCGAFVYEAKLPEIRSVYECNCAVCTKKSYLWTFTNPDDGFTVVKGGDDSLTNYKFGPGKITHKFCPNCGTAVMGTMPDGPPEFRVALNARAIQGLSIWELEKIPYDGAALGDPYKPPEHKGDPPSATVENGKLYTGSCHCGAVTIAVNCLPLDEHYSDQMIDCNCSICQRNGYIWIYPEKERVVLSGSDDVVGRYSFRQHILAKTFCKICGVPLTNAYNPLPQDELDKLSEHSQKWAERAKLKHNVNVRTLHGVDLKVLRPKQLDGAGIISPPYENP